MPQMHSYKVTRTITERVNATSAKDAISLTEVSIPEGDAVSIESAPNTTRHIRKPVLVNIECEDDCLH